MVPFHHHWWCGSGGWKFQKNGGGSLILPEGFSKGLSFRFPFSASLTNPTFPHGNLTPPPPSFRKTMKKTSWLVNLPPLSKALFLGGCYVRRIGNRQSWKNITVTSPTNKVQNEKGNVEDAWTTTSATFPFLICSTSSPNTCSLSWKIKKTSIFL